MSVCLSQTWCDTVTLTIPAPHRSSRLAGAFPTVITSGLLRWPHHTPESYRRQGNRSAPAITAMSCYSRRPPFVLCRACSKPPPPLPGQFEQHSAVTAGWRTVTGLCKLCLSGYTANRTVWELARYLPSLPCQILSPFHLRSPSPPPGRPASPPGEFHQNLGRKQV